MNTLLYSVLMVMFHQVLEELLNMDSLTEIIEYHTIEYPHMQLQDLYKLVYQGVMGSSHALTSSSAAEEWLRDELLLMGKSRIGEKLIEKLSSDILRVNLRPYVASGGDTVALLNGFIRTGREYSGSTDDLAQVWNTVTGIQSQFSRSEMGLFIAHQEATGFSAVHHSEVYRELYRPAYRVVCIKELPCLE